MKKILILRSKKLIQIYCLKSPKIYIGTKKTKNGGRKNVGKSAKTKKRIQQVMKIPLKTQRIFYIDMEYNLKFNETKIKETKYVEEIY